MQTNQEVSSAFVVTDKQLRTARNGSDFLTLKLTDKTGTVAGRVWDNAVEISQSVPVKTPVMVRGRTETFRDELQIQIQEISPLALQEIDPSDFLPVSPADPDDLYRKLKKLLAGVQRPPLQQLMKHILSDHALMNRFRLAPAAKSMHHAYLHGLLEHSVSVAGLVSRICDHYPELDRDLLISGAFLHDVGKVEEYIYDLCIDYSDSGRLLGHMVLGLEILEEKIRTMRSFPSQESILLKHLILSHHGEAEFGAVKLPMTREGFVLHFADDLDAKMNMLSRILTESGEADSAWTSYQPTFSRFFLKGLPGASPERQAPEKGETDERAVQLTIWPGTGKKEPAA